ncbi:sensor histidine kinase [Dictyobacter aurantiacus]|nr:HAMP domain-containing sensor histidine kinase [Dictyobacter aurantiacus]
MGKQNEKKHVVPWKQDYEMPYQVLFEQSALGIIALSTGGRWLQANETFCQLLDYSRGELWKQSFPQIVNAEDRAACMDLLHRLATGELTTASLVTRCLRRDGSPARVRVTFSTSGQRASRNYAIVGFVEALGEESQSATDPATRNTHALPIIVKDESDQAAELPEPEPSSFASASPLAQSEPAEVIQEQLLPELERLKLRLSALDEQSEIRTLGHELANLTRNVLDYALAERADALAQVATLREAAMKMEDFLSLASHELRTPLTTIKANTQLAMRRLRSVIQRPELLLEGADGKVRASIEMLERVERQIGVLNCLVGDMLDVSRIQGNRLQIHVRQEPCDLRPIIEAAVREQHKALPERAINVQFPGDEPILVIADPDRLRQVLSNYLLNALKYSEAQQPIEVNVQLEPLAGTGGSQVRVIVQDKGPGIAPEEQARVWECFYQSPTIKGGSGSGVGMGLGLYISQILIERQGGQVGVTSALDEGSAFWFTLPLAQVEGEQVATEN